MKRPLVGLSVGLGFCLVLSLLSYGFLGWFGVLASTFIGAAVGWAYASRR